MTIDFDGSKYTGENSPVIKKDEGIDQNEEAAFDNTSDAKRDPRLLEALKVIKNSKNKEMRENSQDLMNKFEKLYKLWKKDNKISEKFKEILVVNLTEIVQHFNEENQNYNTISHLPGSQNYGLNNSANKTSFSPTRRSNIGKFLP